MSGKRLRLLLLTHGSPKATAIIERLLTLRCAEVAGIVVETAQTRPYSLRDKLRRSIRYDGYGGALAKVARKLLPKRRRTATNTAQPSPESHARLQELAAHHNVAVYFVENFHLPASIELMRALAPDLGVVLGTNILKESVFAIPRLGSINVHQGLAPYYRGGPPVFWELFNGEREIGLTVHFVAAKVDTGDIIAQETLPLVYDAARGLDYEAVIADYRERLSARAAELVPQAVRLLAEGRVELRAQNLELGKRYRLPTKAEKDELRHRLRERLRAANRPATAEAETTNG